MIGTGLDINRILVIIPVLNEEGTIAGVIQDLQAQGLQQIRVVDNGSTDGSAIAAKMAGAEVVYEPVRGYGQACWQGLQTLPDTVEWLLFCDGDGSDDLTRLPEFFAAALSADLVLGDRCTDPKSRARLTFAQNFGNGLATLLIRLGWGYHFNDLGPLRLVRRSALDKLQMADRGFGWTVEMQVRAVECNLRICEIPVLYRDRQRGRSKISGTLSGSLKAGRGILTTLGKLYWQRWQGSLQQSQFPVATVLSSLLLLLGCLLTLPHGDLLSGQVLPGFWFGIAVMTLGFVVSGFIPALPAIWFWIVAILARALLLPMTPGDDVWRYIWEGYLQTQGVSPYTFPPNAPELLTYRTPWWNLINHPGTTAIYPPVAQLGFRLLASLAPTVMTFKLAFVLADLGVCWLLSRRFGYSKTLLYAWNPLVLYSFAGGAHYDSWFILPLVAAWLLFEQRRWLGSALLTGVSIGVKWVSLPILAFLAWPMRWQRAILLLAVGSLPLVLTAPQFCSLETCPLIPVNSTFVTHGRSAELIPYLLSQVWPASSQHNWYFGIPLLVVTLGLLWRCKQFGTFVEFYFFALLVLSPTVHAWYFTWLIPFGVASRNLGTVLISVSAFVYFLLPHRQGLGNPDWHLTALERGLMWTPLVLGFLWTNLKQIRSNKYGTYHEQP